MLERGDYRNHADKVDARRSRQSCRRFPKTSPRIVWTLAKWLVEPVESADGARCRESLLANVFRHRHREDD